MTSRSSVLPAGGVVLLLCAFACGAPADDVDETSQAVSTGLPCAVEAILARSCSRNCHGATPSFGAPMPLVTRADLLAPAVSNPAKKVYELVTKRIHATTRPMPPPPNARLTESEMATIDDWIASGTPATTGGGSCGGDGGTTDPSPTLSCTPDQHVAPASPFTMPADADDLYVCYGFDVESAAKRHIVGIAPRLGNRAILHHILLFQTQTPVSSTPAPCPGTTSLSWRMVYGWAPGGRAFDFPPEAGFPQERSAHYVVQVHYNNVLHQPGHTDASGFDFCTTDRLRPNDSDTIVFGSTRINLPPRSTVDQTCEYKTPGNWPGPINLFAAFPHMHQRGTTITTTRLENGVAAEDLGTQTDWDFQNQVYFPIRAKVRPGETVRTRCAWKNDGDTTIHFGEGTDDEMCFSFTMYWPKLPSHGFLGWMTPAQTARCRPTEN